MEEIRILFAGGGTGGHLFPALAVAQEFQDRFGVSFKGYFTGRSDKIEGRVAPENGFEFFPIEVEGIVRSKGLMNLRIPIKMLRAQSKLKKFIRERKIQAVVATGSYISFAPSRAGFASKIPVTLMESNVNPGKALKMLSGKADLICTSFRESENYFAENVRNRIKVTGNPIRKELLNLPGKSEACKFYKLNPDKPVLLVFGGSLGAKSINRAIEKNAVRLEDAGIQVIWQTGFGFETIMPEFAGLRIRKFIDNMALAYAAADLVLSRSGATTVAELASTGKPSLLVPLPTASNREQFHNANVFKMNGAAIVFEDNEISSQILPAVTNLILNREILNEMGKCALKLAKNDAAGKAADLIYGLIRH